jgi:hypothetical protein
MLPEREVSPPLPHNGLGPCLFYAYDGSEYLCLFLLIYGFKIFLCGE